jgi:DNA (cytosine-5)-methyltransferase 1
MRVLDLFAGCGGLSLGFQTAGHEIVGACERDAWAVETYRTNFPNVTALHADISTLTDSFWQRKFRGRVDIVVGGPPCQGYSVSGKRQSGQWLESNTLVAEFVRVVRAVRPRAVLLENVSGFRTGRLRGGDEHALSYVARQLSGLNYRVQHCVLQATEYGVPSLRSRFFVAAVAGAFDTSLFPVRTHGPGTNRPPLGVLEAIEDLPPIEAGGGSDGPQPYGREPQNEYQRMMRRGATAVNNHQAMKHTQRLVERFASMLTGTSGYDIGRKGKQAETVTVYKSNNQRLRGDVPSLCITANFQSNYVHPVLHRNLTAREAARLMTFPDRFVFRGKRTLMSATLLRAEGREGENNLSQYNQIGNAVPPLLAQKLARRIDDVLAGRAADERVVERTGQVRPRR